MRAGPTLSPPQIQTNIARRPAAFDAVVAVHKEVSYQRSEQRKNEVSRVCGAARFNPFAPQSRSPSYEAEGTVCPDMATVPTAATNFYNLTCPGR